MRKIDAFTAEVPVWRPYVTPVPLESATDEQREALKVTPSNTKVSDYVLVLAHDPESLGARTPLFNGILYNRGGLSRAERELGAIGASIVNRCIYCAAVHASRFNQLTKEPEATAAAFADGEEAALDPRRSAILRYAMRLSRTPSEAGVEDMAALRAAGLDEAEILDLTLSAALFGWANRLMHTLGEPVAAED
jgi:uncharacterized peroxidase-related enzyme